MAPYVTLLKNLHTAITNSVIKVYCVRVFGGLPDDNRDISTESVFHDAKVCLKFTMSLSFSSFPFHPSCHYPLSYMEYGIWNLECNNNHLQKNAQLS